MTAVSIICHLSAVRCVMPVIRMHHAIMQVHYFFESAYVNTATDGDLRVRWTNIEWFQNEVCEWMVRGGWLICIVSSVDARVEGS